MASYFRQVPDFEYVSRDIGDKYISEYIPVKNLFKRGKLREDIFANLQFFEKYSIIGDERPDNVAYKFYDEETLDWVVLLSNNILNIQSEWPMTQITFEKVMLERYGSYDNLYNGIHHYETEEIKNSLGITVLKGGLTISPTWKTNGNFIEIINSTIADITATGTNIKVDMTTNIPGIFVGSQVTIDGISEREYNGKFIATTVFDKGFTYELPSVPIISNPVISTSKKEKIIFTLNTTFTPIGSILNSSDEVLQNQFPNAVSGNAVVDSETGNLWIYTGFNWVDELTIKSLTAYYYEYWDAGLSNTVQVPSTSFIRPVTNYEYELKIEEEKRNIYILKPIYLSVIFNDMEELMTYKKGGDQYVNSTLKRGDNIRLFE
jgi:hypothetical protein